MLLERQEVQQEDKWDIAAIYPSDAAWEADFAKLASAKNPPYWPEIASYKGRLHEGPETMKDCLDKLLSISRLLEKLYVYAHLKYDEETTIDANKSAYKRISSTAHDFQEEVSWFEPELLALPEALIQSYLASPLLGDFRFHIEKIVRIKKHTLSPEKEELIAMAGKALQSSAKAFYALNDSDFKFGTVKDSSGASHELTNGSYGVFIRGKDRVLRENAFKTLHGKYRGYQNTLTELINGQVQTHVFNAKARKYSSSLEASLFPNNIDTEVYHALIKAVRNRLPSLHKYIKLRKKILGLDALHLYDMYVPLTPHADIRMPYSEAEKAVIESVEPLGPDYQNALREGLLQRRWVDRYENKNKHAGAYSSGCYDTNPYILMNYKELLRDVFTLAHEAGHSMHSLLCRTEQPYQYGNYSIFLAEVASTFNEELLTRYLLERANSKEEKIYLINQKIEDIRGTLFRQTMFAEFELAAHQMAERNIPLTPKALNEFFYSLNQAYFGSDAFIDPEIEIEWARIPHFYANYYVFQYATGISAALSLADKVIAEGAPARDAYLSFLKAGSSRYPIDLLKMAGVDMRSPEPVEKAIEKFDGLVDELEKLLV